MICLFFSVGETTGCLLQCYFSAPNDNVTYELVQKTPEGIEPLAEKRVLSRQDSTTKLGMEA